MQNKEKIQAMFDTIAPTYDKLNHTLSLNIDKIWRKKAVKVLNETHPTKVLDLACGTGDSSIAIAKSGVKTVLGYDISEGMLEIAKQKVQTSSYDIHFDIADAANLPLEDESIDAVFIAFGIRNFENRTECLKEIRRVLKKDGRLIILELSVPKSKILRAIYKLYFLHILPFIGKIISGDDSAYKYLPESVLKFPKPEVFMKLLSDCEYSQIKHKAMSFGLCRLFSATK